MLPCNKRTEHGEASWEVTRISNTLWMDWKGLPTEKLSGISKDQEHLDISLRSKGKTVVDDRACHEI